MASYTHKGYHIRPDTLYLPDKDEWSLLVYIEWGEGNSQKSARVHADETFKSEGDAERHCVQAAMQFIDTNLSPRWR